MKPVISIILIEDEREVLDALMQDLESFEEDFAIEATSSAEEAEAVIRQIIKQNGCIGLLLCDHILPGTNGVDLLIKLHHIKALKNTRKILVTGQAGLEDTVKAINNAGLHHYISKPWQKEELLDVVKQELTQYVLAENLNPMPYMHILDQNLLSIAIRSGTYTDR